MLGIQSTPGVPHAHLAAIPRDQAPIGKMTLG
jgi:hypothetical protein